MIRVVLKGILAGIFKTLRALYILVFYLKWNQTYHLKFNYYMLEAVKIQ